MTAPAEEAIEQEKRVPPIRHAHCTRCQKGPGEVTALCGSKKVTGGPVPLGNDGLRIPPNACVVCTDLLEKPCLLCGKLAY